jgi:hypothetical protein
MHEYPDCTEEWNQIHYEDLWVYNKLFLSRVLGYNCGPSGSWVPKPDFYVVRPSFNLLGMGRFSRFEYLEKSTDHLHPSEFWCEKFEGEHLSVDYYEQSSQLVVRGKKNSKKPLWRWEKWEKIDKKIDFPNILKKLKGNYEWINCEFIGEKLIEVHFRRNPDFRYDNSIAIPVWEDEKIINKNQNLTYIESEDYLRKGFYIDS